MKDHNCCHGQSRGKEECAKRAERIVSEAPQADDRGCGCGKHAHAADQGGHEHAQEHDCGCGHHTQGHGHRGNCQRHHG